MERNGQVYIAPHSYDRYAGIAGAVASVDPTGAARLYATLKPRIQEAYRDLGFPPGLSLDQAVERAIVALLDVPIADEPVRLRPKGIGYAFADERLERLNFAENVPAAMELVGEVGIERASPTPTVARPIPDTGPAPRERVNPDRALGAACAPR
jgi:hypothetical protein